MQRILAREVRRRQTQSEPSSQAPARWRRYLRRCAKIAKAAGVKRESLYRALSERGNPRLSTLTAVLKAVGLKLTIEAARPGR